MVCASCTGHRAPTSEKRGLKAQLTSLKGLLHLALYGLTLATGLASFAAAGWPFELFVHFRVQYAVLASLLLAAFLLRKEKPAAILSAGLVALQLWPAAGSMMVADASTACSGPQFTIATVNLFFRNERHTEAIRWLDDLSADIVVLQEVTPEWAAALSKLERYAYVRQLVRNDPFGIAVISRWPLTDLQAVDLASDGLPSLAGPVEVDGMPLYLQGMHTHTPLTAASARSRDASLTQGAALLRAAGGDAVAIGDLNLTAFSPMFDDFMSAAGLRDAFEGVGWQPTWLAGFWPLALRIDHVLVSSELCVEQVEAGPDLGSDHRPVVARLRFSQH